MIELITGISMLASSVALQMSANGIASLNTQTASANTANTAIVASIAAPTTEQVVPMTGVSRPGVYQSKVREYFKNTPIMIEIARCESGFAQYDEDMNPVRGRVNPMDVGIMQINEKYHLDRSRSLGYDIYSVDGNLAYAKAMYEEQGASPWSASAPCWSKGIAKN